MSEINVKPVFINYKRSWDGKHGTIHVFDMTVEREDGTTLEGVFTTTKKDQDKFTEGQSVTVKLGKTQEDHQDVVKFDKVTPRNSSGGYSGGGGGNRKKDPKKDRAIVANVCLHAARRLLIHQGKSDQVQQDMVGVHTVANKFFEHLFKVTGDDVQKQINYQAQLKDVAETLHEFPNVQFKNSTEFLQIVDREFQWVCDKMG